MKSLSYPWGSKNHYWKGISPQSPDHLAFSSVANALQETSTDEDFYYPVSSMSEGVYPVNGGLEDWAYAASWDSPAVPSSCLVSPFESKIYNPTENSNRCLFFLLEASEDKHPSAAEYGPRLEISPNPELLDGLVSRAIKINLRLAELLVPRIEVLNLELFFGSESESCRVQDDSCSLETEFEKIILSKARLEFYSLGCLELSTLELHFYPLPCEASNKVFGPSSPLLSIPMIRSPMRCTPTLFSLQDPYILEFEVNDFSIPIQSCVKLSATFDQLFANQTNPEPSLPAQTHFARSRTLESYAIKTDTKSNIFYKEKHFPSFGEQRGYSFVVSPSNEKSMEILRSNSSVEKHTAFAAIAFPVGGRSSNAGLAAVLRAKEVDESTTQFQLLEDFESSELPLYLKDLDAKKSTDIPEGVFRIILIEYPMLDLETTEVPLYEFTREPDEYLDITFKIENEISFFVGKSVQMKHFPLGNQEPVDSSVATFSSSDLWLPEAKLICPFTNGGIQSLSNGYLQIQKDGRNTILTKGRLCRLSSEVGNFVEIKESLSGQRLERIPLPTSSVLHPFDHRNQPINGRYDQDIYIFQKGRVLSLLGDSDPISSCVMSSFPTSAAEFDAAKLYCPRGASPSHPQRFSTGQISAVALFVTIALALLVYVGLAKNRQRVNRVHDYSPVSNLPLTP
eukprot:GHVP01043508.1.p1 GENE.GHVP01043508.1~~GHVP01043508.1.p1  ORF type:complete len:681 (+),score=121.94 GHVP01043508.1:1571-3613(+)